MLTLSISDRFQLLQILPPNVGSFKEMRIVAKLREVLTISTSEAEEIGLKQTQNEGTTRLSWNEAAETPLEIELTPDQKEVINAGLDLLEAAGTIPTSAQFVSMYQKLSNEIE